MTVLNINSSNWITAITSLWCKCMYGNGRKWCAIYVMIILFLFMRYAKSMSFFFVNQIFSAWWMRPGHSWGFTCCIWYITFGPCSPSPIEGWPGFLSSMWCDVFSAFFRPKASAGFIKKLKQDTNGLALGLPAHNEVETKKEHKWHYLSATAPLSILLSTEQVPNS
jgi:hypothetical protein